MLGKNSKMRKGAQKSQTPRQKTSNNVEASKEMKSCGRACSSSNKTSNKTSSKSSTSARNCK